MICRKSRVTRGVKPLKPELCVRPRIMRVLLSSANIMAYLWWRVRRKQRRSVACRVSGSTGTPNMLTQARINTVTISSVRPWMRISDDLASSEIVSLSEARLSVGTGLPDKGKRKSRSEDAVSAAAL